MRAFQLRSGISPTGQLDMGTLDALGLSPRNLAYLEPTHWPYESWGGRQEIQTRKMESEMQEESS